MNKNIISSGTISVIKNNKRTILCNVDNIVVINIGIKKFLEKSCNYYGTSYEGVKKSAKGILNINYKVPIVVENNKNIILLPLTSVRDKNLIYVSLDKITNYEFKDNYVYIMCCNNYVFKTKMSEKSFEKLLINGIKLNNTLKYRNS